MNPCLYLYTKLYNTFIGVEIKAFRNGNKFAKKSRLFCGGGGGDSSNFLINKFYFD